MGCANGDRLLLLHLNLPPFLLMLLPQHAAGRCRQCFCRSKLPSLVLVGLTVG